MSNARLRLNHRDPWVVAYIDRSDQILRDEIAWQNAEITKGSEIGKALAAARIKLGIVL